MADSILPDREDAESRAIAVQARPADGMEGIAAFLAERQPTFIGD